MTETTEPLFDVGAPTFDVEALVEDIRRAVDQKRKEGAYNDPRIAQAERTNLANLKDDESFLQLYLDSLRDAVHIDINDFAITDRNPTFGKLLILLKRTIWSMLKFYTYRLWSQQNQVNGLLLGAVEASEERYREKIEQLEARIADLEPAQTPDASTDS